MTNLALDKHKPWFWCSQNCTFTSQSLNRVKTHRRNCPNFKADSPVTDLLVKSDNSDTESANAPGVTPNIREQLEAITDQFTQPGTKYLRDLNDQLTALITKTVLEELEALIDKSATHLNADGATERRAYLEERIKTLKEGA